MSSDLSASSYSSKRIGVVLDIDGVFLKGKKVIPGTSEALQILDQRQVPYVFVTNGGGVTEAAKAKQLSQLLNSDIREDAVLLSHSPFREKAVQYKSQRVLVLGSIGCEEVARIYGFERPVTCRQLLAEDPASYSHLHLPSDFPLADHPSEPCAAAFMFGDPTEWGLEMQILTDVLRPTTYGRDLPAGILHKQRVPLYACNADIVSPNEGHLPRYTQGAFTEAFRAIFENHCKTKLVVDLCGKPFAVQYRLAERMILHRARLLASNAPHQDSETSNLDNSNLVLEQKRHNLNDKDVSDNVEDLSAWHFFGIGDNPLSDIRGANSAGSNWSSVLVRTGVWVGDVNDAVDPANYVFDDVVQAVRALCL